MPSTPAWKKGKKPTTPATKRKQAALNERHAALAALPPIPIKLVLSKNAVINTSSVTDAQVKTAMAGWKHKDNTSDFDTLLPPIVTTSFRQLEDLVCDEVLGGFEPKQVKANIPTA